MIEQVLSVPENMLSSSEDLLFLDPVTRTLLIFWSAFKRVAHGPDGEERRVRSDMAIALAGEEGVDVWPCAWIAFVRAYKSISIQRNRASEGLLLSCIRVSESFLETEETESHSLVVLSDQKSSSSRDGVII